MRFVVSLMAAVLLASACGQGPTQAQASPTPEKFGTATLTETNCDYAMPNVLPLRLVSFTLVNKTRYTGHFGLVKIDNDHTFQNLVDFWNSPRGKVEPAPFTALITEQAVATNGSQELVATIKDKATYALHCGYKDENENLTGFWHELKAS